MNQAASDQPQEQAPQRPREQRRERPQELCEACGFDSDLYNRSDTISSQHVIPAVLEAAAEGLDETSLARRPDRGSPTAPPGIDWSIAEYIDHVREVVFGNRLAIEVALKDPGTDLGPKPEPSSSDTPATIDFRVAMDGVSAEYDQMRRLLSDLSDEQWSASVIVDGTSLPVGWFARHVIHDGLHHLGDIGRIRHWLGRGASTATGVVSGLFRSDGGVPKTPVEQAEVGPEGLAGDRQADRKHHGRPVQAICLWSGDVIDSLKADGHPIRPGAAGENITVSGVAWDQLRPGTRLDIGPVSLLVSAHAIPCAKNAQWFSDRDFKRILHERNPGLSRLYAIPLNRGEVTVGDPVIVEPPRA